MSIAPVVALAGLDQVAPQQTETEEPTDSKQNSFFATLVAPVKAVRELCGQPVRDAPTVPRHAESSEDVSELRQEVEELELT